MIRPFYKLAPLAFIAVVATFFLLSATSHAATITVATGTDETTTNSSCSLSEAITNINDQTQTNTDCIAGDGNNDTITIPAGTISLASNLPAITVAVTIQGQGMGVSSVDGDLGAYTVFQGGAADLNIKNMTIVGYRNNAIQFAGTGTLDVSAVEIDGTGSQAGNSFAVGGLLTAAPVVLINNTYIHDISASGLEFSVYGMVLQAAQGLTSNISVSNTTVENITSTDTSVAGISLSTGLLDGSLTPGFINIDLQNSTIANLNGGTAGAIGIASFPVVNGGSSEVNIAAQNSTFSSIAGGNGGAFGGGHAVLLIGVAMGAQDATTSSFTSTNNIIESSSSNCEVNPDGASLLGAGSSAGTISNLYGSNGGNVSSDATCTSYFTQPTDQNNVTVLAASLLPLANNGGYVPTIALKEDSPAIDAGITLSGITADARGVARPQGTAYDSGAYESPYSKPATPTLAKSGQNIAIALGAALAMIVVGLVVRRRYGYVLVKK